MKEFPFTCTLGFSEVYGMVHPAKHDRAEEPDLCVIILNSGMTHRVGPHRLAVRLARRLVDIGIPAARFDFSGIGNSDARKDGKSIKEQWISQCREVMELLAKEYGYRRFVMFGLCAGGQAAFSFATNDERVVGAILLNTRDYELDNNWERYASMERNARFYIRKAPLRKSTWKRLLTGKSSLKNISQAVAFQLKGMFRSNKTLKHAQNWFADQLSKILNRNSCILFLFSKGDPGLDQLRLLIGKEAMDRYSSEKGDGQIKIQLIYNADHTFTMRQTQEDVLELIVSWMAGFEELHRSTQAKAALDSASNAGSEMDRADVI